MRLTFISVVRHDLTACLVCRHKTQPIILLTLDDINVVCVCVCACQCRRVCVCVYIVFTGYKYFYFIFRSWVKNLCVAFGVCVSLYILFILFFFHFGIESLISNSNASAHSFKEKCKQNAHTSQTHKPITENAEAKYVRKICFLFK